MSLVIQKYGNAALADPVRAQAAARRIVVMRRAGTDVFVVAEPLGDGIGHLRAALAGTDVPVLAGDDTTAVALASALGADACEIYTETGGVFTADPAIVANARVLPRLGYTEMLAICRDGVHEPASQAVELARKRHVELHIRPATRTGPGTTIGTKRPTGTPTVGSWTVAA